MLSTSSWGRQVDVAEDDIDVGESRKGRSRHVATFLWSARKDHVRTIPRVYFTEELNRAHEAEPHCGIVEG